MSWWLLLIFVTLVWLASCFALVEDWKANKAEGKLPPDAGCSLVPGFPLFPLALFGIAKLIDAFVAPWGTWIVFGFHVAIGVLFVVAILLARGRIRRATSRRVA